MTRIKAATFLAATLAAWLFLVGCRTTVVTVTKPDGTSVKVENYSLGNDAKIDELVVPTSLGSAQLRGGASNVNPAVNDIAAAARNITEGAVRP